MAVSRFNRSYVISSVKQATHPADSRSSSSLVDAHRLELVAPGVGDGRFTAVRDHDRGAIGGMQREQLSAGFELRRLREHALHVVQADRVDVGDLPAAAPP